MATIQEDIISFIGSAKEWLSDQAAELVRLEDKGRERQADWNRIMLYIEEADWIIAQLNDPTFNVIDADGNAVLYFDDSITEATLRQLMSDYSYRWGMVIGPHVEASLENVTILNQSGGSGSISLPPGGSNGDRLIYVGPGDQLGWETPATVFEGEVI